MDVEALEERILVLEERIRGQFDLILMLEGRVNRLERAVLDVVIVDPVIVPDESQREAV